MSVNRVNSSTGALSPIAGGTLYADMPVGVRTTWYNTKPLPPGFLRLDGSTFDQTEYPELYVILGNTNVLPKEFDYSRWNGWSEITIGTSQANATTIPYDGVISANFTQGSANFINISNDDGTTWKAIVNGTSNTSFGKSNCFPVKAGDMVYCEGYLASKPWYYRYHGSFKIIKAKNIGLPTDFNNAIDEKISNQIVDSIADGNMKAATSNAVFDQLKNFCMTVQASGSLTIEPNSQQGISLTYTCPQGYTPILAVPRSAGSWAWVWSYCYLQDTSHVYAVIRSVNSYQETQTITANVLCVRTYS